jgi:hypothetical protein
LYLIFFSFSVSLGSATEVLEAGTSSSASLAAAPTTASLVLDDIASETVLEAIIDVDMAVVVENAVVGISDSRSEVDIEVGNMVGVGPTVDVNVSEAVSTSEVIEGVEVGISKSASEISVGDPA